MTGRTWAYLGTVLGGVGSLAANVAHSYVPPAGAPAGWTPERGAVISAVFWPVAVFVAVEILVRTSWPVGKGWWIARFGGLLPVALVAAVVSYRHLSALFRHYGDDPLTVVLGPLAVDGLMVMAAAALLATNARQIAEPTAQLAPTSAVDQVPDVEPLPIPPVVTTPLPIASRANGAIPSGVVR